MADRRDPVSDDRRAQRHESRTGTTYKAFLRRLCEATQLPEQEAERAAVAVLCATERRIFLDEAHDMEAQLPAKLRELLVRCEAHREQRPRRFGKDEFIQMIAADLGRNAIELEPTIRAVIGCVREQISEGEAEQVMEQLPADIAEYWRRPS